MVNTVAANAEIGNTLTSILEIDRAIKSTTVATEWPSLAKLSTSSIASLIQATRDNTIVKKRNDVKHCFITYLSNIVMSSCLANVMVLSGYMGNFKQFKCDIFLCDSLRLTVKC